MVIERPAPFLTKKYVEFRVYYRVMLYLVRNISGFYSVRVQDELQVVHVKPSKRQVVVDDLVVQRLSYGLGMTDAEVCGPVEMPHPPLPGLLSETYALFRK
jgi:hypothetical protein